MLLFSLLIVFLPTQLGIHFWPDFTLVNGIRIDYFSPTIHITDLLVFLILIVEGVKLLHGKQSLISYIRRLQLKHYLLWVLIVGLVVYLNISASYSPSVSFFKWIKLLELCLLGFWIVKRIPKFNLQLLATLLLGAVFYESALVIWQFFTQSSIGGVWYFLGERTFNSSTAGIANAFFDGKLLLRPYGTFSHPNVLAGFLAISLPIIVQQFLHNSRKINATLGKRLSLIVLIGTAIILGYVALLLTMSRVAILVGIIVSFVVLGPLLRRNWKIGPIVLVVVLGVFYLFWPRVVSLNWEREPIVIREQLNSLSFQNWQRSPIFGTGLGTSPLYTLPKYRTSQLEVRNYALQFQPTHNIYLMIMAETGLVGAVVLIGLFILVFIKLIKEGNNLFLTPLLSIAFIGFFDHYFLTLQQGQLLFTLVLSFCLLPTKSASYSR